MTINLLVMTVGLTQLQIIPMMKSDLRCLISRVASTSK